MLVQILKPSEPCDISNPSRISNNGITSFKTCHAVLCHSNDNNDRATANKLDITTSSTAKNCNDCIIAKEKQKAIDLK